MSNVPTILEMECLIYLAATIMLYLNSNNSCGLVMSSFVDVLTHQMSEHN